MTQFFEDTEDFAKIWEDDNNRVFRFSDISRYLEGVSVKELFAADADESITELNGMRIVSVGDSAWITERVFITPDNKAFCLLWRDVKYRWGQKGYKFWKQQNFMKFTENPEWLEWIVHPLYRKGDEWDWKINDELWKPKWIGTESENFDVIRYPLHTDFYEKYGFWVEGKNEYIDHYEYMALWAELKVDDRIVYVFGGNSADFAWFADSPLPSNVRKVQLREDEPKTLLEFFNKYEEEPFSSSFYVPEEPLPKTCLTVNDPIIPKKTTKFMIQFPMDLRRGEEFSTEDSGTIIVLWNGGNDFYVSYTQT